MIHKILKRVRVNFRSSRSDRSATASYRDYHKRVARFFAKTPNFIKKGKQNES